MKAEELMIGDWVISKKRGKDEILQVVTVDGGSNTFWLDGDSYSGLVKGDDIFPIPLTPEILEKNGFKWEMEEYTPDWERYVLNPNFFLEDRLKGCYHFNGTNIAKIRYAHELQHALRLCGLDDLADNFVIKKGGDR